MTKQKTLAIAIFSTFVSFGCKQADASNSAAKDEDETAAQIFNGKCTLSVAGEPQDKKLEFFVHGANYRATFDHQGVRADVFASEDLDGSIKIHGVLGAENQMVTFNSKFYQSKKDLSAFYTVQSAFDVLLGCQLRATKTFDDQPIAQVGVKCAHGGEVLPERVAGDDAVVYRHQDDKVLIESILTNGAETEGSLMNFRQKLANDAEKSVGIAYYGALIPGSMGVLQKEDKETSCEFVSLNNAQ